MAGIRESQHALLTTVLAAGVALGLAGCATSPGKNHTTASANPLVCRLANYQSFQSAAWTHLPAIGVKYVFMNAPSPAEVDAVRQQLASHNLTPMVLRSDADLSLPTGLDRLAEQIETCERLGVRYLFLSVKRRDVPKPIIYERLRQAGDLARERAVVIALETHPDLCTNGDAQIETMRQVHHPNVRLNFDTGNISFYNRNTDAPAELRKSIEYVATVEFKDHNGEFESWSFPALGKGKLDFKTVLDLLHHHRYTGPVTIEIEGVKGITRTQPEIENDIRDSVLYLRSLDQFD